MGEDSKLRPIESKYTNFLNLSVQYLSIKLNDLPVPKIDENGNEVPLVHEDQDLTIEGDFGLGLFTKKVKKLENEVKKK